MAVLTSVAAGANDRGAAAAWLRTVAAALLAMMASVALVCAAVDPYGILGTPAIPGLTDRKIAAAERVRLSKPYRIEQMQPSTIVTGSSAANIGFDPDSRAWAPSARPVYNLGIDGAGFQVQHRMLQHALASVRPRRVVMAVSFEDMQLAPRAISSAWPGDPNWFEPRLRVRADGSPNPVHAATMIADFAFALLTAQALEDSVATLIDRIDPERDWQTAAGFDLRGRFLAWIAQDGTRAVIERSLRQRLSELLRTDTDVADEIRQLAAMVRSARAAGAEVTVIVLPSHVSGLEVRRRMGLSAASQAWLANMVRAVEAAAGGADHIAIWNFEGYDTPVQQPLPGPHDTRPMRWFWEGVHFRPELGTLMLERTEGGGPANFGTRVTGATVADQARHYLEAEAAWVEANPDQSRAIAALAKTAQAAVCLHAPERCRQRTLIE